MIWFNQKRFEDKNLWLITYADLITLLLIFFVLLLSSSVFIQSKYEVIIESIQTSNLGDKEYVSPFEQLENRMIDVVKKNQLENEVVINKHPLGLEIELSNETLFQSGKAKLKPEADIIIREIARSLLIMEFEAVQVIIEGHTDNVPINNDEFLSNWELSVFRAIDVLNRFIHYRIDPKKFKIAGYGDTRPKFPNLDVNNVPITSNQAKNRRIEIKVFREEYRFSKNKNKDEKTE